MAEQLPEHGSSFDEAVELRLRMIRFESRTGGIIINNYCDSEEPEEASLNYGGGHVLYKKDDNGDFSVAFADG
jgi:hypothetical protein